MNEATAGQTRSSNPPSDAASIPLQVLFFEDHVADVELSLWALKSAAFDVTATVAVTLDEVLQRARMTAYDVILSDYRMPSATGMDVFRALKAEGVTTPFILVTGSLGDEKAVECLKEGVADYVLKDRLAQLPVAVRRALEERRLREERLHAEELLRQQNRALEETNQQAQAASRMKSEFLANMSHELRSPLNGIIGFSELMYDGRLGAVTERQKDILGRVLNSAKHLLQLINGVLDLSKVEAGRLEFHPESVTASKLVPEVTGILMGLAAAKQIRLETLIEPEVATIFADPARLKQVLYNYLSNALKFTGEGGLVLVKLKAEGTAHFRLEVSDTGVGIRPEDIEKLFIEFHQLDSGTAKRYQGTGLGLALTKRIVEAQGGTVGVESALGQGSTFFAVLPRVPGQGRGPLATPPPQILLIEDERIQRSLLTHILQQEGFAIQTAGSCTEALDKCRDQSFDAITLDLLLPDGDGRQLLEQIRSMEPNRTTPVIVISMVEEVNAGTLPGVQEVLRKPVSRENLMEALERAGVLRIVRV